MFIQVTPDDAGVPDSKILLSVESTPSPDASDAIQALSQDIAEDGNRSVLELNPLSS